MERFRKEREFRKERSKHRLQFVIARHLKLDLTERSSKLDGHVIQKDGTAILAGLKVSYRTPTLNVSIPSRLNAIQQTNETVSSSVIQFKFRTTALHFQVKSN